MDQPLHASGRICSHSKVCSHSSSFNTGCQESLLSKTPLCQNVSSKYIYRSQFPPRLPSVPAASVSRLTYGSKIRTFCACLYEVQEGAGRSGSGDSTCVKGIGSALFGICFWENVWSSHRVRADCLTIHSQGTAVSVATSCQIVPPTLVIWVRQI